MRIDLESDPGEGFGPRRTGDGAAIRPLPDPA